MYVCMYVCMYMYVLVRILMRYVERFKHHEWHAAQMRLKVTMNSKDAQLMANLYEHTRVTDAGIHL